MVNDNRPGTLVSALGGAVFVCSLLYCLLYLLIREEASFWFLARLLPVMFIMVTSLPYFNHSLSDLLTSHSERKLALFNNSLELERLKLERAKLDGEPVEAEPVIAEPPVVEHDDESLRRARARLFWITVYTWAAEHNGIVSWKDKERGGMNTLFTRHQDWLDWFIRPSIQKGWLAPVFQGSKTRLASGITLSHILNELSADRLPTLPYGEPPELVAILKNETVVTSRNTSGTLNPELGME